MNSGFFYFKILVPDLPEYVRSAKYERSMNLETFKGIFLR
jgi:hypothetical protein